MMDSERYGKLLDDGALRFVRELPGPIERVWDYLVDPEKRSRWLAGGKTGTRPGEPIEFDFDHDRLSPHDDPPPDKYKDMEAGVSFQGEILTIEPPRLLHFLWPEGGGGDTEVLIRLSPVGDRVRLELELEHRRIKTPDDLTRASAGWHVHLDILDSRLNNVDPNAFWPAHQALEDDYADRLSDHLRAMKQSS